MAKFERDIVIADDDGNVYHLTQEQLSKMTHVDKNDTRYRLIFGMLEHGVAAAAIPSPEVPEIEPDAICFLLNLGALRKKQPYE